jgi:hypothetical protein
MAADKTGKSRQNRPRLINNAIRHTLGINSPIEVFGCQKRCFAIKTTALRKTVALKNGILNDKCN